MPLKRLVNNLNEPISELNKEITIEVEPNTTVVNLTIEGIAVADIRIKRNPFWKDCADISVWAERYLLDILSGDSFNAILLRTAGSNDD